MSLCPCLRVSMSPCLSASMSPFHHVFMLHVYVSIFPCLHIHVSLSLRFNVSISMSLCLYVLMSQCLNVHVSMFPEFRKWKTELKENGYFRLLSANRKWNWQTFICLLQTEIEGFRRNFVSRNGSETNLVISRNNWPISRIFVFRETVISRKRNETKQN